MHDSLLKLILERQSKNTLHNGGILTADRYVKTIQDCIGSDLCYRYAATKQASFDDILRKAAKTLTYNNPDMEVEDIYTKGITNTKLEEVELPKNTLMVFRHCLTSSRKDRDGDILRTKGAVPDPKMLLLWQHVHTLPIGKVLAVSEHTDTKLSVYTAIVDINELAHDAAVMIDNKMGRFSHGFRAISFTKIKEEMGEPTSGGFDVLDYEIMEASLVSVPSNVDAEVEEILLDLVEGKKLKSSLMKNVGKGIRDLRSKRIQVPSDFGEKNSEEEPAGQPDKGASKEGCSCGGGGGTSKETDDAPTEEEGISEDKKVITVGGEKFYSGTIPGSWEYEEGCLSETAREHLILNGIEVPNTMDMGYVYLMATFEDYAIIGVHDYVSGEMHYYRSNWERRDDEPHWIGSAVEVTIEMEATIEPKLFDVAVKQRSILNKVGRMISASNADKIRDVIQLLQDFLSMAEPAQEVAFVGNSKDAIGYLFGKATVDECRHAKSLMELRISQHEQRKRADDYRSLIGINRDEPSVG